MSNSRNVPEREQIKSTFEQLGFDVFYSKRKGNKIIMRMCESSIDDYHQLNDMLCYLYNKLEKENVYLIGDLDAMYDLDFTKTYIEYSVEEKDLKSDLHALFMLV